MLHRVSVVLLFEKALLYTKGGADPTLLKQKSRMPLAGLVYLHLVFTENFIVTLSIQSHKR